VFGEDPSQITINGTTLDLRDCRNPIFSSHDASLAALAAIGLAFVVFWLLTMLICLGALLTSHKKTMWICFLASILFLLIGAPMLGTGAYYGRWEKIYDVQEGCDDLPRINASVIIPAAALDTPVNFTIAYVGDSGASIRAIGVWQMIAAENPDVLVHLGDYDYCDDPTLWGKHLKFFFGTDFPIIPVIGNHELHLWDDYSAEWDSFDVWSNYENNDFIVCEGIKYVNYWCIIRGVFIAFSSVGTKCGDGYKDYTWHENEQIRMLDISQESRFKDPYINCVWHKDHNKFQLSTDRDEVGPNMYDICAAYGALTISGHDHVYGRTHAISNIEDPDIQGVCQVGDPNCLYDLTGDSFNATIIATCGLGGWDTPDLDPELTSNYWWAQTYGGAGGALFCVYNVDGSGVVYCYFKNVNGTVVDEFTFDQKGNIIFRK